MRTSRLLSTFIIGLVFVTSCASNAPEALPAVEPAEEVANPVLAAAGLRLVSADEAFDISSNPPEDLIVLDVRTAEEFAEGHIEGALMIDFYRDDFADRLAELDPTRPYLLYCRSGNRSGQTVELMRQLGFTDVADVDGGIIALTDAGHPLVAG